MSSKRPDAPPSALGLHIVRDDSPAETSYDAADSSAVSKHVAPAWRSAPKRPSKIVELDGVPRARWRIEADVVYLWNQRLWRKEPVGCVLCFEHDDDVHPTLSTLDDSMCVCLEHGALTQIAYSMKKVYTITLGGISREGEETLNDTMLFPAEMTLAEQNALIERLLDEAQVAEAEAGAAPQE